jgi:hypothetical protein
MIGPRLLLRRSYAFSPLPPLYVTLAEIWTSPLSSLPRHLRSKGEAEASGDTVLAQKIRRQLAQLQSEANSLIEQQRKTKN